MCQGLDDTSTDPSCADSKLESTVGVQLFDDAKKCCAAKFGWYQPELCLALVESGGEATNTGKWERDVYTRLPGFIYLTIPSVEGLPRTYRNRFTIP